MNTSKIAIKTKKSLMLKILSMAVVVTVLTIINIKYIDISPAGFSDWLGGFSVLAPVVFIGLYILRPIILFPITIFYITGGLVFDPFEAALYAAIGGAINAVTIYMLASFNGVDELLQKAYGKRLKNLQERLEDNGFIYIFLLRNVPIVNYDLISYAAGVSKAPFRQVVLGSFFGNIPSAYLYGYIGFSFSQGEYYQGIIITIIVLVAISIGVVFTKKHTIRKSNAKAKEKAKRQDRTN